MRPHEDSRLRPLILAWRAGERVPLLDALADVSGGEVAWEWRRPRRSRLYTQGFRLFVGGVCVARVLPPYVRAGLGYDPDRYSRTLAEGPHWFTAEIERDGVPHMVDRTLGGAQAQAESFCRKSLAGEEGW